MSRLSSKRKPQRLHFAPRQLSRIALLMALTCGPSHAQSLVQDTMIAQMFGTYCAQTLPDFSDAEKRLRTGPFSQADTGTFYHDTLNLSFKLVEDTQTRSCSMVFASDSDASTLGVLFGTSMAVETDGADISLNPKTGEATLPLPGGGLFVFYPGRQVQNQTYYRAVVQAQK